MPSMDMSAALTNPITMDVVAVQRRTEVVNSYGETSVSVERIFPVYGVVYPDGQNKLDRRPESQTMVKTLTFITKFAMRSASNSSQPDILFWHGNNFTAMTLEDYSNYGPGFTKVMCTAVELTQVPPVTQGTQNPPVTRIP